MTETVIFWFRQDLRVKDNPALTQAAKAGPVLPLYILDDENGQTKTYDHTMGGASRLWLHHSLSALNKDIDGRLLLFKADPLKLLPMLAQALGIKKIFWNRCYEPWRIKRDSQLKKDLKAKDIAAISENGSLLWEPWEVQKPDGTPYRVFTPFYKKGCLNALAPRKPFPRPKNLSFADDKTIKAKKRGGQSFESLPLEALALLPQIPWHKKLEPHWQIGEKAAHKRLKDFLKQDIDGYKQGRDFPAKSSVSRLSPHLHFGELSPNQVWHAVKEQKETSDSEHFCRELAWREFSYSLLYYNPDLPTENLQDKFNTFPWETNNNHLKAWQQGQTGYPIIDAGMRELWQTGYMHNRVRMIVGSFLVKNLLIDWREGERWFWDCLFDADLANNSASWQWVAGCGADAAPYFRIFNPITQGKKFDPEGDYTLQYVPELKDLPKKFLFEPWEANEEILKQANIKLGKTYPTPIVDIKPSRERALAAFQTLKEQQA